MPSPVFKVHQSQGGKVEGIQYMVYANGQTFATGEVLIFDGSGNVTVAGANPTGIVGVALQAAGSSPGFDMANNSLITTFTYRSQKVSVARPNDQTIFAGYFTNGSSAQVAAALTDVGLTYGITAYNSGTTTAVWTIDKAKNASNQRVTIVGVDLTVSALGLAFFKFLPANLA